ncbi:hypothetical protein G210_1335 [Candida maltosa Xu316]|uniref:FAD-binding FR-type domain-containing protein n=1 Tax=Candida maltosa (strain Xu316) TaxID=1245528 RepID=M3J7W1_CANMX|nr:hypothetical protein G210_1335 [Candida maltosa Xu316]
MKLVHILLLFIASVSAMKMDFEKFSDSLGFYTCNRQIRKSVTYCGKSSSYTCLCSTPNALATYAGCLAYKNRNTPKQTNKLVAFCAHYGDVTVEEDWFPAAYTNFLANAQTKEEIANFSKTIPITVPFKFSNKTLDLWAASYAQYLGNYDNSVYYGYGLLGYWGLVMLLGAVAHWSKVLFPGLVKKNTSGVVNWWRKYISMPATFKKKRVQEQKLFKVFDCLIPTRFETVVIAGFYIVVIVVHAVHTGFVEGDPYFLTKYMAQLRYLGDRTGIVTTVMMPLVFLFAGRNNFLQWLTGWNYNTFMTYHRHIARVMFCLIVIHAVCYTIIFKATYTTEIAKTYMIWGVIAIVSGGIILIQAMLFFRRRWYELFLLVHIIFAALWVAGTWLHVEDFGYLCFVYPTVAVWCFDRLVRIIRLLTFGFPTADIELLDDGNLLKMIIPKPKHWKAIPGGHVFVHFMKLSCFWQSHPFTYVESTNGHSIILYCKIKGGITHSLCRMLASTPGRTGRIAVGIEGPYGESTPARYADTAVFIAGGIGIPGIYSEIMDIARNVSKESRKSLKLIWIVREYKGLLWFKNKLEDLKDTGIETTIYLTKAEANDTTSSKIEKEDEEDEEESITSDLEHIIFKEYKPSIEDIVVEEINESNGSTAFVVCGNIADDVRYSVCQNIDKKRVDFYEQVQVWC